MKTFIVIPLLLLAFSGAWQWQEELRLQTEISDRLEAQEGELALAAAQRLSRLEVRFVSARRAEILREHAALVAARQALAAGHLLQAAQGVMLVQAGIDSGLEWAAADLERQLVQIQFDRIERDLDRGRLHEAQMNIVMAEKIFVNRDDLAKLADLRAVWRLAVVRVALESGDPLDALAARARGSSMHSAMQDRIDALILDAIASRTARYRDGGDFAELHRFLIFKLLPRVRRDAPDLLAATQRLIDEHYRGLFGRSLLTTSSPAVQALNAPIPVYESVADANATTRLEIRNSSRDVMVVHLLGVKCERVHVGPGATVVVKLPRAEYLEMVEQERHPPRLGTIDLSGPRYLQILAQAPVAGRVEPEWLDWNPRYRTPSPI